MYVNLHLSVQVPLMLEDGIIPLELELSLTRVLGTEPGFSARAGVYS